MDSRVQRYIRAHPDWSAERIAEKFSNLTIGEIEREQNAALQVQQSTQYSEIAVIDDDGEYDHGGDYKGSGQTEWSLAGRDHYDKYRIDLVDADMTAVRSHASGRQAAALTLHG